MYITDDIRYIGVNDHDVDLFEGQYDVPNGMAYNSYLILDEKVTVMDTVDARFTDEWLGNMDRELAGRTPDYLVVQHMEPDHSGSVAAFMDKYPSCQVVASKKAFPFMKQFHGSEYEDRRVVVKEGDTLETGRHTLNFVEAVFVHWPEVIMTYDSADKVLFSADGFGKFGALDVDEAWDCEARRYYFGIVGKYGAQVQKVLGKVAALGLEINTICPLHGPVLTEDLGHYLGKYDIWSSYKVESTGVVIACASIYGHTMEGAKELAKVLEEKGCPKVSVFDLARDDMAEAVEDAFRYGNLVLACNTYNAEINPFMRQYIGTLVEHGYQNRTVSLMENGTWAPTAAKVMAASLEGCKNLTMTENKVTIRSALNDESRAAINVLADEIMANIHPADWTGR
ncbi:MAG: FprA family A-type flavoprotein [Lachnospiraceae bacterium]|nr:FprA family A-type flavoprotein [Lachnospiraceae bacterium]